MLSDEELKKFKLLLENEHNWPCSYTFKFIAPKDKITEVEALFPNNEISQRPSKNGNYISCTIEAYLDLEVVIAIYQKASDIEGIISM